MGGLCPDDLAKWSGGKWLGDKPRASIDGFAYDTRILKAGDVFVALKTDQRNGHDFLRDAKAKGAVAALVQEDRDSRLLPLLRVNDTLEAFQSIARNFRDTWRFPVISITGSCGKTTTKDLLCHLLGGPPQAQGTRGNLNNLIGVPATLLEIDPDRCGFAVVEAGISEPGEMERLAGIIDPDRVVFTAIGPAHLERLGSEEGVAKEKGLLANGPRVQRVYLAESCRPYQHFLNTDDGVVVSDQDVDASGWQYRVEMNETGMCLKFAARNEEYSINGSGHGLASNAALAIAVARDLGVSPEELRDRLSRWKASGMRGEWKDLGDVRVFLDCYNANPLSMRDSLETFNQQSDPERSRLYIIGCMEELGSESARWHRKLGTELRLRPKDRAYLIGDEAVSVVEGFSNASGSEGQVERLDALEGLKTVLPDFRGDVFLKGSRKYRLETVMDYFPKTMCDKGVSC